MIRYRKQAEKFILSQKKSTALRLYKAIEKLPEGDVALPLRTNVLRVREGRNSDWHQHARVLMPIGIAILSNCRERKTHHYTA